MGKLAKKPSTGPNLLQAFLAEDQCDCEAETLRIHLGRIGKIGRIEIRHQNHFDIYL